MRANFQDYRMSISCDTAYCLLTIENNRNNWRTMGALTSLRYFHDFSIAFDWNTQNMTTDQIS